MEPVLVSCEGCGSQTWVTRPEVVSDRPCPWCGIPLKPGNADAGGWEPGLASPRGPVRLAAEAGLLLALFTALLFRLAESPGTRASAAAGIPLAAAETHAGPSARDRACGRVPTADCSPKPDRSAPARILPPTLPSPDLARLDPALPVEPAPTPTPLKREDDASAAANPVNRKADPAPADADGPRRIRVRNRAGRTVVARVHGEADGEVHVMLPDGQLGIPDRPAFTPLAFETATADEMARDLLDGPFAGFQLHRTPHYLIVYRSTSEFAEESGRVLESLYKGLTEAFRKFDVPVHESEFPLVAVIFRSESDFRAHKPVDPSVQAYYEIYSNRIFFYQTSERDELAPEVAALRRPQTVAHEGTHQILSNIGIHPRLAPWPPWLIEGLAEYCSTPLTTRRGTSWAGLGVVNSLHLATIRDLDDPLSGQVAGSSRPEHIGRKPGMPLVEYLARKTDLTPTDYALSWAMTHYLARKRVNEFVRFLRTMSALPPLQTRTPDDQLDAFRQAFGKDLVKLDHEIGVYLSKLKVTNHLPYYAVMFEQRVGGGLMKRAAIVSQSPSMIRQWLDTVSSSQGDPPLWQALPFPNRTPALATAQDWVHSR